MPLCDPGEVPIPGLSATDIALDGQGSGFCYQLSEFNPLISFEFTARGACFGTPFSYKFYTNDGVIVVDGNSVTDTPTDGSFRYDSDGINQLGATSLLLQLRGGDPAGNSVAIPVGPFDPQTSTMIELVTNTGTPTGSILFTTTHDDDTGGELPIGLYTITFSLIDDVSDQGLDLDLTGITWEIWTMPHREGDLLASGSGVSSRQVRTSQIIVDKDLLKAVDELDKNDASGVKKCFKRYLHVFNGGCNEDDVATYTVCIQPWKNDVQGEHLVHVRQSTNHEENVSYSDDVPVIAEQDLRDDINLFAPATAYRPGEPNGFWSWGGSLDTSSRDSATNDDDDDHPDNDLGPPDPDTGIQRPENEDPHVHWTNIQIETDPGGPLTVPPPIQAPGVLSVELLSSDLTLNCGKA